MHILDTFAHKEVSAIDVLSPRVQLQIIGDGDGGLTTIHRGASGVTGRACASGVTGLVSTLSRCALWGFNKTLKMVIYVENHPQKRSFRLADYHLPLGGGVN